MMPSFDFLHGRGVFASGDEGGAQGGVIMCPQKPGGAMRLAEARTGSIGLR